MVNSGEGARKTLSIGFRFRVSPEDEARIRRFVEESGVTLSEFLRAAATRRRFRAPQVPKVNLTVAGELARIGNNLNQLARHANAGRFSPAVAGELAELRQIVKEVQSLVLGVGIRETSGDRAGDE